MNTAEDLWTFFFGGNVNISVAKCLFMQRYPRSAIIQMQCFSVLGIFTDDSSETLKNILLYLSIRVKNLWKKKKRWKSTLEGICRVQNRYTE